MSDKLIFKIGLEGVTDGRTFQVETAEGFLQALRGKKVLPGGILANIPVTAYDGQILGLYMLAAGGDLTIETDMGETKTLFDGEPLIWKAGRYYPCPFTKGIDKLKVENHGDTPATFTVLVVTAVPVSTEATTKKSDAGSDAGRAVGATAPK